MKSFANLAKQFIRMEFPQTPKRFAIFPPIGISRIGNSEEFFLAPENSKSSMPDDFHFKDKMGRIKKQVARFRIFEVDGNGFALQELTSNDAKIQWRVHLANQKAAWYQFNNALDLGKFTITSKLRNHEIKGEERKSLIIDAGIIAISGNEISGKEYRFDKGTFRGLSVELGELRTDEKGRLLVFGGDGIAASVDGMDATTFANNDGWYDDTSDGTIRATIVIDGIEYEALPAVVAVAPPNYGPGLVVLLLCMMLY